MPSDDFTFAVISDTHFQTEAAVRRSPYPSDGRANDRARRVVEAANALDPEFVIHLGDVIHPLPTDRVEQEKAYATAREILGRLEAPLHAIPGNHDVGDKAGAWVPVPPVDELGRRRFQDVWGTVPRSFDHGSCHFVLLDGPVMGSGLPGDGEQRKWLEEDLTRATDEDRRILLFAHYPPYLIEPEEEESYDNLPVRARTWFLELLERHGVEALFTGHVHHFRYERYGDTDLWVLPSIGFVRPEFSELWPMPPTEEFGRDDPDKLGFVLVRVGSDGYRLERIRTERPGADGRLDFRFAIPDEPTDRDDGVFTGDAARAEASAPLGLTLRHPWARARPLSVGSLDELHRRTARDDEWLSGVMSLGVRRLRVPLNEVKAAEVRNRISVLAARGYRFTFFGRKLPDRAVRVALQEIRHAAEGLELVAPIRELSDVLAGLSGLRDELGLPLYLAPLALPTAEEVRAGAEMSQFPDPGFAVPGEAGPGTDLLEGRIPDGLTGLVFRVEDTVDPWHALSSASADASGHGLEATAVVHLRRAPEGSIFDDDRAVASRAVEALLAGGGVEGIRACLDAYVDYDRAYLPRHGLLDRRGNPRAGQRALLHLRRWIGQWGPGLEVRRLETVGPSRAYAVERSPIAGVVLTTDARIDEARIRSRWPLAGAKELRAVDLCTGEETDVSAVSTESTEEIVLEGTFRAGSWLLRV